MKEEYYSIEEIAKTLKVSYLTVFRWIRAGKLKSIKAGKQHRINKVDLDKFLNNHQSNVIIRKTPKSNK